MNDSTSGSKKEKLPNIKTAITHIDKDSFWTLIAESKQCCGQNTELAADWLCEQLGGMFPEEIVRFHAIFHCYHTAADRFGLWSAAVVMQDGCSDDGFMDFRSWLIAQGKDVYLNAMNDPDSLAELNIAGNSYCESVAYVASYAYEKRTGGGDLYAVRQSDELKQELQHIQDKVVCGEKTRIPMEWHEVSEYLPKLCAKYLTPQEIEYRSHFPMWNYDSPSVQEAFRAAGKPLSKEKHRTKRGGDAR